MGCDACHSRLESGTGVDIVSGYHLVSTLPLALVCLRLCVDLAAMLGGGGFHFHYTCRFSCDMSQVVCLSVLKRGFTFIIDY